MRRTMTTARLIDDAFTAFASSSAAQHASEQHLDALACWRWPSGYIPTRTDYDALLSVLQTAAPAAADGVRQPRPLRTTSPATGRRVAG